MHATAMSRAATRRIARLDRGRRHPHSAGNGFGKIRDRNSPHRGTPPDSAKDHFSQVGWPNDPTSPILGAMETATFRFENLAGMRSALEKASHPRTLEIQGAEGNLAEATWVLALFEIGTGSRATAAAGRLWFRESDVYVVFQGHDWDRLVAFAAPEQTAVPASTRTRSRKGKVLAVEDERIAREMIKSFLEAAGFEVRTVGTAEEALHVLPEVSPDAVVLDWTLPGMNGLELCRTLRRDPSWSRIPILFLTANHEHESAVAAFEAGANDYIRKPIHAREFQARVMALVRRSGDS